MSYTRATTAVGAAVVQSVHSGTVEIANMAAASSRLASLLSPGLGFETLRQST
jgi:hypothetical protein